MQKIIRVNIRFTLQSLALAAVIMMAWPVALTAAQLDLSTKPMYVGNTAPPNLVFVMDDSGSMGWDYLPDEANDNGTCKESSHRDACIAGDPPYYAKSYNKSFYNPGYIYTPGVDYLQNSLPEQNATNTTNWTQVDIDGFRGTTTINLTSGFRDRVYYTTSMVYDRTSSSNLNNCGTAPCMEKNGGSIVTMRVTGHVWRLVTISVFRSGN